MMAYIAEKENFTQFKDIQRKDQEIVMSRLLSETFTLETTEVEFD
jgi:hypothetical protein